MSLDYMNMLGMVANQKVIDIQTEFDTMAECFYYTINFQIEKRTTPKINWLP